MSHQSQYPPLPDGAPYTSVYPAPTPEQQLDEEQRQHQQRQAAQQAQQAQQHQPQQHQQPPPPSHPPPPPSHQQPQQQHQPHPSANPPPPPQHHQHPPPPPPQQQAYGAYPKIENFSQVIGLQQQAQHATHALTEDRSERLQPFKRLRKACDSCSLRKVKCDEGGPPCKACANLDIPCTFDRPSRRRGPPNRHVEAFKRRRVEGAADPASSTSPTNAAHALAQLQSSHTQLSAEAICDRATMNALIDDFFTHVHPLCPFPHEPSFRENWENREDLKNPSYLALLASMIACLVASFPRKPRLHLKNQVRKAYPSHLTLVDKCRDVCAQARGPGFLDRPGLNVYDACTSYFLGLTGGYTFQWRQLRLYFGECLTILRSLGLHKAHEQGYNYLGAFPAAMGSTGPNFEGSTNIQIDHVTEQVSRRVFWTVFVGARTMHQLGASFGELSLLPSTPTEQLPPLPAEVDDDCIYPHKIAPQPTGKAPLMAGFNINVRIYTSYSALSTVEMTFGIDELFDWDRQQRVLEQCLQQCKQVLDHLPDVLQVQRNDRQGRGLGQRRPYYPPMPEFVSMRDPALDALGGDRSVDARRSSQYEIQKANIYASHLSTRSYLVEKYFSLLAKSKQAETQTLSASQDLLAHGLDRLISKTPHDSEALEKTMFDEREQVIRDLLIVLGSIDMVNMEPNGDSFTQKIRSIAKTLLEVPDERKGSMALQHQDYLYKFLDVLSKLERVSPEGSDPNNENGVVLDEESELRHWADLREYQMKFQEQGGAYGFP